MKKEEAQELILLRHSIKAIRDQVNGQLDGLDAEIDLLIPENMKKPRRIITDWREETNKWRKDLGLKLRPPIANSKNRKKS